MKRLLPFIALLIAIPATAGDICNTPHQVTTVQAAVPFLLPAYGAAYTGVEAADAQTTNDLLRELLAEIKALRAENATKGGPSALSIDPKAALVKNCASCHTAGKLKNTDF